MQTTSRLLVLCASLLAPLAAVPAQEADAPPANRWRYLMPGGQGCKVILHHDGHQIEIEFRDGKVQPIDAKDAPVVVKPTKTGGSRITTKDGTELLVIEAAQRADAFSRPTTKRAHLGVTMGRVDDSLAAHLDVQPDQVTLVLDVAEGQPADKAGVKKFDLIVAVDGETPATEEKVRQALARKKPGDPLTLKVLRRSGEQTLQVTLGETTDASWPAMNQLFLDAPKGYMLRDKNMAPFLFDAGQQNTFRWAEGRYPTLQNLFDKKQSADEGDSKADLESIKKQLDRLDELLKKLGEQVKDK